MCRIQNETMKRKKKQLMCQMKKKTQVYEKIKQKNHTMNNKKVSR